MKNKWTRHEYRRERVSRRLGERASGRPRLIVRRSLRYIYAQVVNDAEGKTLAQVSSLSPDVKASLKKSGKNLDAAKKVGEAIAKKALAVGVKKVVFDRGGNLYHGRIKAVAEAARTGGLEF